MALMRYFHSLLWLILLFTCILGWGRLAVAGRFYFRKTSPPDLIFEMSLGLGILGLGSTYLLVLGAFNSVFLGILLLMGFCAGILNLKRVILHYRQTLKGFAGLELSLMVLIIALLGANLFTMLGPSGGQETFQYHYYLPQLYLEQNTLFLKGFELYDGLLNVWGYETHLALANWAGGMPLMSIQVWSFYLLFALQIFQGTYWLYSSRTCALLAMLLALLCPVYCYFLWWTKPELPMTGFLFLLLARWISRPKEDDAWTSALLGAFVLSLKITALVILPIVLCFAMATGRLSFKFLGKYLLICLLLFMPWIIFLLGHQGGLGTFPLDNPNNFSAPFAEALKLSTPLTQKYWKDFLYYANLFKPASYFFVLGLPLFVVHFRRYGVLILGLVGSMAMAAVLMKPETPFADEFRYVGFVLFVVPVGAAVASHAAIKWKDLLKWPLLCLLLVLCWRRASVATAETWRHHGAYLKGEQSLQDALAREGSQQYQAYLKLRKNPREKLLHLGHGNIAVHGPEVIHVGSWSKNFPVWKYQEKSELLAWCRSQDLGWILFERGRYQTYARGFGGPEYKNSALTAYYVETLKALANLKKNREASSPNYALINLSSQEE